MAETSLRGCRVLVAEDEYILADDLCRSLRQAGATVLGPAASVREALSLVTSEPTIDGAVLDINLRGEMVFPVADVLSGRGVPFLFATGYEQWVVPEHYCRVTRCEKPYDEVEVVRALLRDIRIQKRGE